MKKTLEVISDLGTRSPGPKAESSEGVSTHTAFFNKLAVILPHHEVRSSVLPLTVILYFHPSLFLRLTELGSFPHEVS